MAQSYSYSLLNLWVKYLSQRVRATREKISKTIYFLIFIVSSSFFQVEAQLRNWQGLDEAVNNISIISSSAGLIGNSIFFIVIAGGR